MPDTTVPDVFASAEDVAEQPLTDADFDRLAIGLLQIGNGNMSDERIAAFVRHEILCFTKAVSLARLSADLKEQRDLYRAAVLLFAKTYGHLGDPLLSIAVTLAAMEGHDDAK